MTSRVRLLRLVAAGGLCAAILTLSPTDAFAQRRGRPVARGGAVVVAPRAYVGLGIYDPFFWGGWGPGWGAWGPGWYPPFGPAFVGANAGSARIQVTPKKTEVYVDGYMAGTVDDFDGFFQRLDVEPGEHELTLYLEGYETITEKVLFRPGATLDIKHTMHALPAGASSGPRPTAASAPPEPAGPPEAGNAPMAGPDRGRRMPPPGFGRRGGAPPRDEAPVDAFGTLAIRVQPGDATLLIDGEEWEAPEGDGPILIDLPEGPHDVEVRKEGRPAYRRTVQVRAGRTIPLNVSLSR